MKDYKIIHKETLLGVFYVEADSEQGALDKFYRLCGTGKVDFGYMELLDRDDTAEEVLDV